jgi:DNA repair protein RecO (recombination protein O)
VWRARRDDPVPARETEAIILRTYPLKEADKIVSAFTRSFGKLRGVARGARKPKSRYGAALEPLSYVRLWLFEKETADLLSVDNAELIQSFFDAQRDYAAGVALAHLAEVTDQIMPERQPQDAFFRLLLAALEEIRKTGGLWPALTYFDLWAVRLGGFLPDLSRVPAVKPESKALAAEMLRKPLPEIAARPWSKATAVDLRRFLERQIELHIERRLVTRQQLEELD